MQGEGEKPSTTYNLEEPHPVDVYVGERVRYFRELRGMSQQQLGKRIGVRFQQVQKYESGANRTSASRLFLICEAFDITLPEFFASFYNKKNRRAALGTEEAVLPPAFFRMRSEKRRKFIELIGQVAELVVPDQHSNTTDTTYKKPECKARGNLYRSIQDIADEEGLSMEEIRQKMVDLAYPDNAPKEELPPPPKYLVRGEPYMTIRKIADAEGTSIVRIRQKIMDPSCTEYQRLYKRRT